MNKVALFQALASLAGTESEEFSLGGELLMLRERASIIAIDMLRKYLLR